MEKEDKKRSHKQLVQLLYRTPRRKMLVLLGDADGNEYDALSLR